ncbi:hypothetical protein BTHE68_66730 (plasmid) [Burkholderia sp. THE68]|jgi:hypothetical protein|uniref:DUF1488 domain-containing protein n=1 Tax=Burkholderiaceae TaxID=119060 RepID=UPI00131802C9|nr:MULTISPECIES: DUF1488 domain-containing protein [Burkholderiaceae]BBU32939.1 hypothetical protein BTHE68_66730 [Burkholderia sp. THE68]BCQ28031.1 DUF1488 family protein [Caballeronia sp. NK8]
MIITFPSQTPVYQGDVPSLTFAAVADGEHVECTISAEALEDHFGAASWREEDLQQAFESHRSSIEGAAEHVLSRVGGTSVMLRSGFFRFREARAQTSSSRT